MNMNTFNWTIWNWNCSTTAAAQAAGVLLIEPFGIETDLRPGMESFQLPLLIEPFGIETGNKNRYDRQGCSF